MAITRIVPRPALESLLDELLSSQGVTIAYHLASDQSGNIFDDYDAVFLPSIFLIDQTGLIRLRYDGASDAETFFPELDEIISMIDELLE